MAFRVRLSREAATYLERLPYDRYSRVLARLDGLAEDPVDRWISKPLSGGLELRTSRLGDLCIIYAVDPDNSLVLVRRIAPRGQAYRRL